MEILAVRPIKRNDVPLAVALDRVCFGKLWSPAAYLREVASPNSTLIGLWKKSPNLKETIIGIACLWSIVEEAHITLLGIYPDDRGQGLGQLLLLTLLQDAVARKLQWATLEVKENNLPAIALYEKFGFAIAGRRPKYYQKTNEDALILWCKGLGKVEFSEKLQIWQQKTRNRLQDKYYIDCIECN